jgi:hypothetical protein
VTATQTYQAEWDNGKTVSGTKSTTLAKTDNGVSWNTQGSVNGPRGARVR